MKNQTLEPLASAKWSLLFLLVPVASDDMDINGKIEILQKGESCGSLGLFCFFCYVRWLALWMAFVYLSMSMFAVLPAGDLLTFLACFSPFILLIVNCLWFHIALFC